MKKNIPLMKVFMAPEDELMENLKEILYSGFISEGDSVERFEKELKKQFSFSRKPLSVNSGTAALKLAFKTLDVRDKIVLATPMNCTAGNMAALDEGAKIVWCDIDSKTGNIDPESIKFNIEKYGVENIAAISTVDFAGYLCDFLNIERATEGQIPVIEDAAQSLGGKYFNEYVGQHTYSDFTCFSFQAIKTLTTGDGGALVMSKLMSDFLYKNAKLLKWFGIDRSKSKDVTKWHYDIPKWGFKGHMNNIAATIGLNNLKHTKDLVARHQENGKFFDINLKGIDGLDIINQYKGAESAYWIYLLKVDSREDFGRKMKEMGIGANIAHVRNDKYSCFKNDENVLNSGDTFYGLEEFNTKYISIPCGWWVTDEDREYIVDVIKKGW